MLGANRPIFSCSPSEKSPLWLKLRAEGQPGHGSTPHADNAVERLIRALYAVQNWDRAVTIQPHTAEALQRMRDANAWAGSAPSVSKLCQTYPAFAAVTRDTISNTGATSGIKHNVIPADAEATLDCRLLPGESYDEFIKSMRNVIDDGKVDIEVVFGSMGAVEQFRDRDGQRDRGCGARAGRGARWSFRRPAWGSPTRGCFGVTGFIPMVSCPP